MCNILIIHVCNSSWIIHEKITSLKKIYSIEAVYFLQRAWNGKLNRSVTNYDRRDICCTMNQTSNIHFYFNPSSYYHFIYICKPNLYRHIPYLEHRNLNVQEEGDTSWQIRSTDQQIKVPFIIGLINQVSIPNVTNDTHCIIYMHQIRKMLLYRDWPWP